MRRWPMQCDDRAILDLLGSPGTVALAARVYKAYLASEGCGEEYADKEVVVFVKWLQARVDQARRSVAQARPAVPA